MQIILKNATLFAPKTTFHFQSLDLRIENGIITEIAPQLDTTNADIVIERQDLHVSAGWYDPFVAFGEPGFEERETLENGLKTAALSGFTGIGLLPTSSPPPDHQAALKYLKSYNHTSTTAVFPIANFTQGGEGKKMAELYDLTKSGAIGFLDDQTPIKSVELLKTGLLYAQRFEGMIMSTPQDASLTPTAAVHEGKVSTQLGLSGQPALSELLQIQRDIAVLGYTQGRLHIPCISSRESVEIIRKAKKDGHNISCSVALANLCFTDEVLMDFETHYKVYPPLREERDKDALREGLMDGTIDFVTSNHRPLNPELKYIEFEHAVPGTIGLEAFFGVLNTLFPLEKTIQLLVNNRKMVTKDLPQIAVGSKADLTLFTPNGSAVFGEADILSSSKNCAFTGCSTQGKVYGVIRDHFHQLTA